MLDRRAVDPAIQDRGWPTTSVDRAVMPGSWVPDWAGILDPEIGHRQSAFRLRPCISLSPSVQTSIKCKSNIRMDEIVRVNVGDHFGRLSRDARIMGPDWAGTLNNKPGSGDNRKGAFRSRLLHQPVAERADLTWIKRKSSIRTSSSV